MEGLQDSLKSLNESAMEPAWNPVDQATQG